MKINNTFIMHLRSFAYRKGGVRRPFIYPIREWAVCLLICLLIAGSLLGYAALDFNNQLNDRYVPVVSEEQIPKYRPSDAEFIIRYYEGRTRSFDALRGNKVVLPSVTVEASPSVETGSELQGNL